MRFLEQIHPFTPDQLEQVNVALPEEVRRIAVSDPLLPHDTARLPVQGAALLHSVHRVFEARSRLAEFQEALRRGIHPLDEHELLQGYSPIQRAGTAVGQLAIARTLVGWYGLTREDMERTVDCRPADLKDAQRWIVEQAVSDTPEILGITTFRPRNVYAEEARLTGEALETAVRGGQDIHGALAPYLEFSELPQWHVVHTP